MPRSFRHNLYRTLPTSKALARAAERPGVSQSAVVEAALKSWLDGDDGLQAVLFRRLDQMARQTQRHDQHTELVLEALGLFVQSYFNAVPPVPARDQAAQKAIGAKRFEAFVAELGKRVAGGTSLAAEVAFKIATGDQPRPATAPANDATPRKIKNALKIDAAEQEATHAA